jgi:hypothetical protein
MCGFAYDNTTVIVVEGATKGNRERKIRRWRNKCIVAYHKSRFSLLCDAAVAAAAAAIVPVVRQSLRLPHVLELPITLLTRPGRSCL